MYHSMSKFETVQTYKQLLDTNIKFLKGEIEETPYHGGPVDTETLPLLEDLVMLNEKGFFTVSSQPSMKTKVFVDKTWKKNGIIQGNWWYESEQKSYVEGYIPKDQLSEFQSFIKKTSECYYEVYIFEFRDVFPFANKFFPTCFPSYKIINTIYQDGNFPTNISRYNVTREKCHKNEKQLDKTDWDYYTNCPLRMEEYYDIPRGYDNIDNILVSNTCKIILCGKQYNEGSVIDTMKKFYHLR